MQITLENLRQLVKETLSEAYYGASQHGGLASPAFQRYGPQGGSSTEIALDPNDISNAVVVAIRHLIKPVENDEDVDARQVELERCRKTLEGFGDEAVNAAGQVAADALINTSQIERNPRTNRLYEQKKLLKEARSIIGEIEAQQTINPSELTSVVNKIIKLLDSMDMSLDLIYGALSGHEGPISAIRGRQKYLGRTMTAKSRETSAGNEPR